MASIQPRRRPGRVEAVAATTLDNTPSRYGAVAVVLHWTMALLLVGLSLLGLYMARLPDVGFDKRKVWLVIYHKEFGMAALALVVVRLAWSATGVLPGLATNVPEWQNIAARFVHLCFYGLMLALPITGWIMSSAAAIPVSIFGLFYLPDLVPPDDQLFRLMVVVHHWFAYGLIACFAVHAGAALYHHYVLRDDTLRRMLP
jgi:cytochrome b561